MLFAEKSGVTSAAWHHLLEEGQISLLYECSGGTDERESQLGRPKDIVQERKVVRVYPFLSLKYKIPDETHRALQSRKVSTYIRISQNHQFRLFIQSDTAPIR